jgi:DNA invertase Pin-like site-specific DNA recombinase
MSTDHQQYSLENQRAAILEYAAKRGFYIVQTYSDGARSGVLLKTRPGLLRLLSDVMKGEVPFASVLVYDVSRWGRFQDADESAHYEFMCKSAGVFVHYCAEPFANDNSLSSSMMKGLKRIMAGEFSRELGASVFEAGRRAAQLGFKQGGSPGYALRRWLISADGDRKQILARGETKCLQTDRVVLVPGPAEEVECVREIYRLVVEEKRTPFAIAKELNRRGMTNSGREWRHGAVKEILTHPKYTGCNVWGRVSRRLGGAKVAVPKAQWVLRPTAFEPIVDSNVFEKAQRVLAERTCAKSNDELLESLRAVLAAEGKLSSWLLQGVRGAPSAQTCIVRFGSLRRAFELAGYCPPSREAAVQHQRESCRLRQELLDGVQALFPHEVSIVYLPARRKGRLLVDEQFLVDVFICRYSERERCWIIADKNGDRRNMAMVVLLNPDSNDVQELRIVPPLGTKSRLREHDTIMESGKHLFDLSEFCTSARSVANRYRAIWCRELLTSSADYSRTRAEKT